MEPDAFDAIREMRAEVEAGRPLVFIPIDENGDDCGPPEAVYTASNRHALN